MTKPVSLGTINYCTDMENEYFPLGNAEDNKIVKILRIALGTACILVAAFWLYFTLNSVASSNTIWVTIAFMAAFGLYQIRAGLGKTTRFISFGHESITVKKKSLLSPVSFKASDISKIDIYPLSVVFIQKADKKFLLRFGAVNYETNGKIVDELINFAGKNGIAYEVIEEEI